MALQPPLAERARLYCPPDGFVREVSGAKGSECEWHSDGAVSRVEVPPGHIICFFGAVRHESFTKHSFPVRSLFAGFQLAPTAESSSWPFGDDPELLRLALEQQSVIGLKSGHVPDFSTKLRVSEEERERQAAEWADRLDLIPQVRESLMRQKKWEGGWHWGGGTGGGCRHGTRVAPSLVIPGEN